MVYEDSGEIWMGEEIIAWRIITHAGNDNLNNSVFCSTVSPITANGEAGSAAIGYRKPNGAVALFEGGEYNSLEATAVRRAPKTTVV